MDTSISPFKYTLNYKERGGVIGCFWLKLRNCQCWTAASDEGLPIDVTCKSPTWQKSLNSLNFTIEIFPRLPRDLHPLAHPPP